MKFFKKVLMLFFVFPVIAFAAVPQWEIIPEESHLTFTGTQNNAPLTGEFKKFSGQIFYDPTQLKDSRIKIIVDLASVSSTYNELVDTLKSRDWFNTSTFPDAIFTADKFVKLDDQHFEAKGTLTLHGETLPVTLDFSPQSFSDTKTVMKGSTTIKRTAFHIGQGEWADTSAVKDEVQINFVVSAKKK